MKRAVEKGRLMNGARTRTWYVTVDLEGLHGQRAKKNGWKENMLRCVLISSRLGECFWR